MRKGLTVCAHFVLFSTTLQLIPHYSSQTVTVQPGDRDRYEHDVARQRELERCGWTFWHVRESTFNRDPEAALHGLWITLDRLRIYPSNQDTDTRTLSAEVADQTRLSASSAYKQEETMSSYTEATSIQREAVPDEAEAEEYNDAGADTTGETESMVPPVIQDSHQNIRPATLADSAEGPVSLSPRELEILRFVCREGLSNNEIAQLLGLSVRTVEVHRFKMMKKLGVSNVAQLFRQAMAKGLI